MVWRTRRRRHCLLVGSGRLQVVLLRRAHGAASWHNCGGTPREGSLVLCPGRGCLLRLNARHQRHLGHVRPRLLHQRQQRVHRRGGRRLARRKLVLLQQARGGPGTWVLQAGDGEVVVPAV